MPWQDAPIVGSTATKPKWQDAPVVSQAETGGEPASGLLALPSEGLSGVNEGLANLLSLPNNIELGLRSVGPMIGNALGGKFAMPTESLMPDAGADYRNLAEGIGAIKPPADNGPAKFVRRFGQEVGANILPVAATPAKVAGAVATLGSGLGAATAETLAPGNEWAELAGQVAGGLTPTGVANSIEKAALKKAAPSVADLKAEAKTLYDAARDSGVTMNQRGTIGLSDDMFDLARTEGLVSPTGRVDTSYPRLVEVMRTLDDYSNGTMNVPQMQAVRRKLQDAAGSADKGERRLGKIMLNKFDDLVTKGVPELADANAIYHRAMKGEAIETAIELAGSRAGQFSGSGFENALRTEFRALDREIIKGKLKGLSDEEIAAIRKVANGGPLENIARYVGKFAPTGAVSFGASAGVPFAVGTTFGGPLVGSAAAGATMGAGFLGRTLAENLTSRNAQIASALMRKSPAEAGVPFITPKSQAIAQALAAGQVANQNGPDQRIIDALKKSPTSYQ